MERAKQGRNFQLGKAGIPPVIRLLQPLEGEFHVVACGVDQGDLKCPRVLMSGYQRVQGSVGIRVPALALMDDGQRAQPLPFFPLAQCFRPPVLRKQSHRKTRMEAYPLRGQFERSAKSSLRFPRSTARQQRFRKSREDRRA